MIAPSRRGFLRDLTTLPLVGGSVALIGSPSAAAVPVTPGMLATYSAWLWFERRALMDGAVGGTADSFVPCVNPGSVFHFPRNFDRRRFGYEAAQRAPVILAAAGCALTSPDAEAYWGDTFRTEWMEGGQCA